MPKPDDGSWEKYALRLGLSLAHIQKSCVNGVNEALEIREIRIKLDADNRTSVLVILKALRGDDQLVGFVGGHDLGTAIIATAKKVQADAVRWRVDRPWSAEL